VNNSFCLREVERVYYYCVFDGCITQMLLCQKPLLFTSERPESENNKFTKAFNTKRNRNPCSIQYCAVSASLRSGAHLFALTKQTPISLLSLK